MTITSIEPADTDRRYVGARGAARKIVDMKCRQIAMERLREGQRLEGAARAAFGCAEGDLMPGGES